MNSCQIRPRAITTVVVAVAASTKNMTTAWASTACRGRRGQDEPGHGAGREHQAVAKSFGSKYVEFDTPSSPIRLALYSRRAAAKDVGVSPDGTGSHRIVTCSDAGPFTGPDGFAREAAPL